MSLIARESGGASRYPLLEAGSYPAICYAVVDLGEQYSQQFDKSSRKVTLMFELPGELIEVDGQQLPRAISETYTLSLSEKSNLRRMLETWRGRSFTAEELRGFDLENLLGAPCLLGIIHAAKKDGSPFAKIGSVGRLPKGMQAGEPVNEKLLFDLDAPGALDLMDKLPQWLQNRIRESESYRALLQPPDGSGEEGLGAYTLVSGEEDLPF